MTKILLRKKCGELSCSASGHAGFAKKGEDIACAAVTVLMRTSMQTFNVAAGIEFESSVPQSGEGDERRGELSFVAKAKDGLPEQEKNSAKTKIDFLAEFLLNGFKSLSKEFPNNIEFKLEE